MRVWAKQYVRARPFCDYCKSGSFPMSVKGGVCRGGGVNFTELRPSNCEQQTVTNTRGSKEQYNWPELMFYLTMKGFGGRPLVLGPTVYTYVKYDQLEDFSAGKF